MKFLFAQVNATSYALPTRIPLKQLSKDGKDPPPYGPANRNNVNQCCMYLLKETQSERDVILQATIYKMWKAR